MENSKKWYASKTVWLQVVGLVALIVPQTAGFIQEHFVETGAAFMVVNMFLRFITKDKLEIK